MYAPFFGLSQDPFSIAPDPRFLFMSERHREALAHLIYGVSGGGGFVLLSGEIGAGKTTVCRCFLEQIPPRSNVAYIFNPKLTVAELLKSVCDEFGVAATAGLAGGSVKDYVDPLNEYLLRTHAVGQNNVLVIDEAQNLSADVLEQLRLLTNLETNERKLLQIILIGQPELRDLLARPELEQLAQRVIARFHLEALSASETDLYIRHRLSVAGLKGPLPFDAGALRRIHRLTRGIPRRINLLCDRALLGAYAMGRQRVDRRVVDKAAVEVLASPSRRSPSRAHAAAVAWFGAAAAAAIGMAAGAVVVWRIGVPRPLLASGAVTAAPTASAGAVARAASAPVVRAVATPSAGPASASMPAAAVVDLPSAFGAAAHDDKQAWRELGAAWRLTPPGADPCDPEVGARLQCYRGSGITLAMIRQLDRPGILTLQGAGDKPVYALLSALSNQTATLRIGDSTHTVSLQTLATFWRGDFATLWRAPEGYAGGLVTATSGAAADWLVGQLDRLQQGAIAGPGDAPEPGLRARVASFQTAQGLKADGRAGPTTFMQLNRAIGVDEPHLQVEPSPH